MRNQPSERLQEKKAAENRVKFSRTKQERLQAKQDQERADRLLDGHKLETTKKQEEDPAD